MTIRRLVLSGRAAVVAALLAVASPGAAAAQDAPPSQDGPPPSQDSAPTQDAPTGDFVLSTPGGVSRWMPVERRAAARIEPRPGARRIVTLGTRTPEGTTNLVLALARREVDGRVWIKVRLPVLPNNTTGWIRRSDLGGYTRVRTHLLIDRARFRLRLVEGGRTVFRARIGVGLARWPTPAGSFYVRSRLEGFRSSPVYGPVAFGLSARSAVLTDWPGGGFIGIHGTDQPGLLPGRVSHGCIRLRNADIRRLARRLAIGTPVTIR